MKQIFIFFYKLISTKYENLLINVIIKSEFIINYINFLIWINYKAIDSLLKFLNNEITVFIDKKY